MLICWSWFEQDYCDLSPPLLPTAPSGSRIHLFRPFGPIVFQFTSIHLEGLNGLRAAARMMPLSHRVHPLKAPSVHHHSRYKSQSYVQSRKHTQTLAPFLFIRRQMKGAVSGSLPGGSYLFRPAVPSLLRPSGLNRKTSAFPFLFDASVVGNFVNRADKRMKGRRGSCTCSAALNTCKFCLEIELHYDLQQLNLFTFISKVLFPEFTLILHLLKRFVFFVIAPSNHSLDHKCAQFSWW